MTEWIILMRFREIHNVAMVREVERAVEEVTGRAAIEATFRPMSSQLSLVFGIDVDMETFLTDLYHLDPDLRRTSSIDGAVLPDNSPAKAAYLASLRPATIPNGRALVDVFAHDDLDVEGK